MKNIHLIISYDGSPFLGWQKTPLGPTVEQTLEEVLSRILQEDISLQAASRTDAHVHAEGQSVNFFCKNNSISLDKLHKGLNALLPPSIVVRHIAEKPLSFHPTLDAFGKEYHYFICNTPYQLPKNRFFSWHVPYNLELEPMQEAALSLTGTHDFSAFCNSSASHKNPVCTLQSFKILPLEEGRMVFRIVGNRFLYRMARNLVGTLLYVGRGRFSVSDIPLILSSQKRSQAGVTAAAHGLHLIQVFYRQTQKASP